MLSSTEMLALCTEVKNGTWLFCLDGGWGVEGTFVITVFILKTVRDAE